MTEKEIQDFHDILFQYLLNLHEQDNSLLFQVQPSSNIDKLSTGRWLNGNDNLIGISFWEYHDDAYQVPTMMLGFNLKSATWIFGLFAGEPLKKSRKYKIEIEERRLYFEKMAKALNGFSKNKKDHVWHKEIYQKELIGGLQNFIQNEKPLIDKYIKDNPPETTVRIGFIEPKSFVKQIKKITEIRGYNRPLDKPFTGLPNMQSRRKTRRFSYKV